MNKPLAIGLIIFFILIIAGGAIWLMIGPAPEVPEPERGAVRRFFGLFGPREEAPPPPGEVGPPTEPEKRPLTLLSAEPVAGFKVLKNGVRFIERRTGHVWDIGPQGENKERISNTTIPKIFEAVWSQTNPSKAILKYFVGEDVRIVSVEFVATSTKAAVLPANILSAAYAPDKNRILYLLPSGQGARTIAADPDNTKQSEVFFSPFQEWEISWPEKNTISYLSRPSAVAAGFLFSYDLQKGAFNKILGDILGLEAKWSASGQKVLYSAYSESAQRPQLFIYDLKTKQAQDLQTQTLAAKCVFDRTDEDKIYCGIDPALPQALWPDEWLRGVTATLDIIWEINLETGEKKILNADQAFNISRIDISADDQFLYFVDKNNNSLWSLRLAD